jgi:DNA-binding MarR family transcriptional regulator
MSRRPQNHDRAPSGETRWLTEEEQRTWQALAGMVLKLPSVLDSQLQGESNLSMFEYFVLSALSTAEGRTLRMSDLAAIVNGSLSRLSNVVKRLEQRGCIRREPDPDNGRYTVAVLTDSGWSILVAAAPGHVTAVRRFVFEDLTREEMAVLRDVSRRIVDRIDPASRWP